MDFTRFSKQYYAQTHISWYVKNNALMYIIKRIE